MYGNILKPGGITIGTGALGYAVGGAANVALAVAAISLVVVGLLTWRTYAIRHRAGTHAGAHTAR